MADTSYYAKKKEERDRKIREALEARKKRTSTETGKEKKHYNSNVQAALEARKSRILGQVDEGFISTFMSDASDFFTKYQSDFDNRSWKSQDDMRAKRQELNDTWSDLTSRASTIRTYAEANKATMGDNAYKELVSYLDGLAESGTGAIQAYGDLAHYYSNWKTEDDWLKGAQENWQQRQQRYEANLKRIEELTAERKKLDAGIAHPAARMAAKRLHGDELAKIDAEIAALTAENKQYERGEGGWTYKKSDDHYHTTQAADFGTTSAKRDYTNPTQEALQAYDNAAMTANTILGQGGYQDDAGNVYNRRGEMVKSAGGPGVQDKLGLYLQASDEEKNAAITRLYGPDSNVVYTYGSIIEEGNKSSWEYLTDQELGIYYTYLGESQEKAYRYLYDMTTELNRRQTLDESGQWAKAYDEAGFLGKIFMNAASVPASVFSGVTGSIDNAFHTLTGQEINPYSVAHSGMHYSDTVKRETAEDLDASKIEFLGVTPGDVYQFLNSRAVSGLATKLFGPAGTVVLGMGAAQQEAYRLYKQGATDEQIALGSLTAGAAEVVFEYASFDKLVKMGDAKTIGQWVKNALIQGGVEASEEAFTEISNIITNAVIMGKQSDIEKLLASNGGDWGKTGLQLVQQVFEAGVGGFFGGLMAGGWESGKTYVHTQDQYRDTGRTIIGAEGGVDALQKLAMEKAGVSEESMAKLLGKQSGKVSGEIATGKGLFGKIGAAAKNARNARNVGMLYSTVQDANNQANASANQADIAKSLQRKGFNAETASDISAALVAQYNGQELTKAQERLLKSVEDNPEVMKAISDIIDNVQSTVGQRQQDMRDFWNDVDSGVKARRHGVSVEAVKKMKQGKYDLDIEKAPESEYEVSEEGKTTLKSDPNKTINIKKIASIANGVMTFETDAGTVDAADVVYGKESDALIYEHIADLGGIITADDANRLVEGFAKAGDMSAEVYARGMTQAYRYAYYGYSMADAMGENTVSAKLTEAQRNTAFAYGRAQRKADTAKAQEERSKFKDAAEKAGKTGKKGGVYFRSGSEVSDIDSYMEKSGTVLKDVQKVSIETMKHLAEALGLEFYVYESYVKDGKRYYIDENGKEQRGAPNGWYDQKTGKVYIDLHAGNDGRGAMLFTIAHELTHFIHQWSPEKFTKLADIIFSHKNMKGQVAGLVAEKMRKAEDRDKPISYEVAYEEVVADGMESILTSGRVMEMVADIKQQDRGLWQKICDWFKDLANYMKRVVAAYQGKDPDSVEGKMVAEMKGLIKEIEAIYAEGLVDASENFQAAQAQFSTDSIRGTADGAVAQSEVTSSLVAAANKGSLKSERTEFEYLPKQMMSLADGSGTLLDFIEGVTGKKVKGLGGKAINGYTGRDVRAYAMGISGFTKKQVNEVNKFMDAMSAFMEEAGVTYKFIGLDDVKDAKLHYTYNADGSIKSIVLSAMVKNGDYPVNFDLSSICKKREAMSKLMDKLAKRGSLDSGIVKLTPGNIFKINTALKDAGYETACLGCFVESKRYNSLEWATKFCNKWNAAVKKVNPNATYFGYGDATFNEDSFTLEQAIKIDEAATKYITTTKTERLANALAKYRAKEQAGLPLVEGKVLKVDGVELNTFSKAARKRLMDADISDELKTKYLTCDVSTLNIADVEFLLENGILPGAALSNKQAVTEMVKSGEAYQHLLRPSDLLTDRGISKLEALPNFHGVLYGHYGSGTPKLMQSYTPYNSEIALLPSHKGDQTLAEYLYKIAGVRMQSFSDFQIQNIYDYLQMVADLTARKLPAHAYTKEISFAKLLGMTGIKVNLSVMFDIDPMVDKAHAGLTKLNKLVHRGEYARVVLEDEQGKWVYNIGDYQTQRMFAEAFPDEAKRFLQSIGFADAVKLQSSPGYSANCGIIGVGYSDLGIFAMLDDNRIRYIIPYHASSLPAEIKLATNIALGTDYTPYQNNMKISGIVDRNGNAVNWSVKEAFKRLGSGQAVINELNEKIRTEGWVVKTTKAQNGHGSYGLYEDLMQTNDPRQTASNFMDWCCKNGTLPLFYQFASHQNYYKLLYDFNVYDCVTEEYAPQQAVTNTYPTMVDGQVQPGNVTDGGFDAEYFQGAVDKQMAFMDEYSRNRDADLETLAENMEEGTLLSVREDMTEEERYEELKNRQIFAVDSADTSAHKGMLDNIESLPPKAKSKVEEQIYALAEKLHILRKPLSNPEIKFEFQISKSNGLKKSIHNQLSYGGSYGDFSKALVNLDLIIPNAILIEAHTRDRYEDTPRANGRFEGAYVLLGAFRDGGYIIPVKLEVKKEKGYEGKLYVVVAMTKIKRTSVTGSEVLDLNESGRSHPVTGSMYSLQHIISKINTQDADFLKYIPDGMLSEEQIAAKRKAKADEDAKIKRLRDSAYLNAVNRGDMETAQRMVDEAAKAAGYTTKAYHGTRSEFNKFDIGRSGGNYDGWSQFGKGMYFSKTVKGAEHWASMAKGLGKMRVMPTYLRLRNPLVISHNVELPADVQAAMEAANWEASWYDIAKPLGYDGIVKEGSDASDEFMNAYIFQYVVFDANQIKSADPITYDDSGKVIPLSQRFNEANDDIRYSERDSDYMDAVNRGDMEIAQRMVDEAAKAAGFTSPRLFHGTSKFGFTRFDPTLSYDMLSIFLSNSKLIAQTYSGGAGKSMVSERASVTPDQLENADPETVLKLLQENIDKSTELVSEKEHQQLIEKNRDKIRSAIKQAKKLAAKWGIKKSSKEQLSKIISCLEAMASASSFAELENANSDFKSAKAGLEFEDGKVLATLSGLMGDNVDTGYKALTYYLDAALYRQKGKNAKLFNHNMAVSELYKVLFNGVYQLYTQPGNQFVFDAKGANWNMIDGKHINAVGYVSTTKVAKWAKENGYDSVQIKNLKDSGDGSHTGASDVYIFFGGNRLKSADPVTYDDQGNVIPLSERFNPDSDDIRYQEREEDSVSNRALLANAFEGIVKPDERPKLEEYRGQIERLNAEERKLQGLNEQIKALSFAKGPRDTEKIKALREEAAKTADRISKMDKILLRLEASKPLQSVLAREKKKAYSAAEQKGKEALAAYRERATKTQREMLERWHESVTKSIDSRRRTVMRHKIQDVVKELNQYLLQGTKDRHVPIELQKAVAEALDAVNMDTVGAEERIAKLQAELMKAKAPEQIQEISRKIDHIQQMGDRMNGRLQKLKDAYDQIVNSDDPLIANSHDEVISNKLQSVIEDIGDTPLRDMTLAQLEDVYDMYRMVLTTIRNANKAFKAKKAESISTIAGRVMMEVEQVGGKKKLTTKLLDGIRIFFWNNLKPVYAFERIGSNAFTEVYNNVRAGEDVWAVDVTEAREYYLGQSKKHNYDSWDFTKRHSFTSTSGMEFSLNLEQIMSLYAYSKRDQAADHLKKGGIVIDETTEITIKNKLGIPVKFNPTEATAYNISEETLAEIVGQLTDEQKAFVDEMQDYLSTVMGEKGNEVSLEMYGIKLFKEKFYFPLKSATQFMAKAKEQQQGGDPKIKNKGFSKETVQKASNPIVLTPFMDVWADHVNEMSMYHAFVLPMEDFYRVYNYKTPTSETLATESVEMFIQNAYGKGATKYIDQLLKDLNGGAMSDPRESFAKSLMSKFKKAKVMASLSVVIQQPSAIGRAYALVAPKYFRPTMDGMSHEQRWEELKKYAPIAVIKEMGYFDTGMGMATKDFIKAKEYTTFKEKVKGIFTDENYRDELVSKAPALADELTWCAIWNAVKRETVSTHKDLRPGSEEFLKAAGERFTEVITKTQVYDSVLARSANMRSKTGLMSMVTSFMAEPTTTANILEDAILKAKRGHKGYAVRAFASVAVSVILNNALVSLVYAGRDDDEDETFLEKYMQSFVSGTLDDMNPLTYYPYLKDMWSVLQGFDIERADMSLVSDLADATKSLVKAYASEDGDVAGAWWDIAGTVANIGGIPLQNFRREVLGAVNFFGTVIQDVKGRPTTWGSLGDAIGGAALDSTPIVGWVAGESKTDKLYDAIVRGDKAYVDRLKGSYKDTDAYNSAVRKALLDHDPRVKEAAQAQVNGNPSERVRIARAIIADGFPQDGVVMAINSEINALTTGNSGTSAKKENGFYTAADFAAEIANGDQSAANAAMTDIIRTAEKNGKSAEDAKKSFVSSATSELKALFQNGKLSVDQAIDALETYCGKTEDDAMADVQYWSFEKDYPDVYADDQWFDTYYEKIADSNLPIDVYMDYRNKVSTITGEGKKEKRMAVINSLPITRAQKDALYLAEGWAESKLYEAPWH